MMDKFYLDGNTIPDKIHQRGKSVINMNKIKKFGMDAVERLAGEGGELYNLDKAYGEQLNRLLTT